MYLTVINILFMLSLLFSIIINLITTVITGVLMYISFALGILNEKNITGIMVLPIITLVSCILIGVVVSACSSRAVLKNVREFIEATDKLSRGDFSARLNIRKPPEFRILSKNFNTMAEELGSIEVLRTDFINNFSHEFKTPIISIKGFVEILKDDDLSKEERNEYLDIIIEESKRLTSLATNVLNLSKIETQAILFIGATGAGKSTLINLIPRFYDATEGEVLVDGVNVKEYDQKYLRNKLGYVSQKVTLFEGTVESNVAFGENGKSEITKNDVIYGVYAAQAAEFVEILDGEYDAHISQGGTNLSGGQKQRLSIARAIARYPEILIFDDSFSALDYKTDSKLRKFLKKESIGTTMLVVAQRISSIRDADKIIVLEDGQMVGIGKHDELMKTCNVYKEIAYSQLSKEELAVDMEAACSDISEEEVV